MKQRLVVFVVVLFMTFTITGCGTLTGIPSHGGGKRFAVEQQLVSTTIRGAIKQIDVSALRGKTVYLQLTSINDKGGGNLSGGRGQLLFGLQGITESTPVTITENEFQVFDLSSSNSGSNSQSTVGGTDTASTTVDNQNGNTTSNSNTNGSGSVSSTGSNSSTTNTQDAQNIGSSTNTTNSSSASNNSNTQNIGGSTNTTNSSSTTNNNNTQNMGGSTNSSTTNSTSNNNTTQNIGGSTVTNNSNSTTNSNGTTNSTSNTNSNGTTQTGAVVTNQNATSNTNSNTNSNSNSTTNSNSTSTTSGSTNTSTGSSTNSGATTTNIGGSTNTSTGGSTNNGTTSTSIGGSTNASTGSSTNNGTTTTRVGGSNNSGSSSSTTNGSNTNLQNSINNAITGSQTNDLVSAISDYELTSRSFQNTSTSNHSSGMQQVLTSQPTKSEVKRKGSGYKVTYGAEFGGQGNYQNFNVPVSDIAILQSIILTYFYLNDVNVTLDPNNQSIDAVVYINVDVFGSIRSRFDTLAYNKETVSVQTVLEVMAVDRRDQTLVMLPTVGAYEAVYDEKYVFWIGPINKKQKRISHQNMEQGQLVSFDELGAQKQARDAQNFERYDDIVQDQQRAITELREEEKRLAQIVSQQKELNALSRRIEQARNLLSTQSDAPSDEQPKITP